MDWMFSNSTHKISDTLRKLQNTEQGQTITHNVLLVLFIVLIVVGAIVLFCMIAGIVYACSKRSVAKKNLARIKAKQAQITKIKPSNNNPGQTATEIASQTDKEIADSSTIGNLIAARWREDKSAKFLADDSFFTAKNASAIQFSNKKQVNQSFEMATTEYTKREQNKFKEVTPDSQKENNVKPDDQQPGVDMSNLSFEYSRRFSFGEPVEHLPTTLSSVQKTESVLTKNQSDLNAKVEESFFQDPKPYNTDRYLNTTESKLHRDQIQLSLNNSGMYKSENIRTSPDRLEKQNRIEGRSKSSLFPKLSGLSNKNLKTEPLNPSNLSISQGLNQSASKRYVPRNYSSRRNKSPQGNNDLDTWAMNGPNRGWGQVLGKGKYEDDEPL